MKTQAAIAHDDEDGGLVWSTGEVIKGEAEIGKVVTIRLFDGEWIELTGTVLEVME